MTDDETARRLAAALDAQAEAADRRALRPPLDSLGDAPVFTIEAETRDQSDPRRRRRIAMVGAATAGVAAVAAVALVAANLGSGTSGHGSAAAGQRHQAAPAPSSTSAAPKAPAPKPHQVGHAQGVTLLKAAAAARQRTGDPTVGPGQYLRQTVTSDGDTDSTWRPARANSPTVKWVRVSSSAGRFAGVCNDLYQHTQDPPPGQGCGRAGSFDDVSPKFVANLPHDPAALYTHLRQDAQTRVNPQKVHDVDALILMDVDSLFESNALPASRQAELIRAAAMIPSAKVYENEPTEAGRRAIGIVVRSYAGKGHSYLDVRQVNIDPSTGRYAGFGPYSGATVAVTNSAG